MQVLFVVHRFGRLGGLEIYNLDTAHALQRAGANVLAIGAKEGGHTVCERVPKKGALPRARLLQYIIGASWPKLLRRTLENAAAPDLVIAGHVNVLPEVARYARRRGVPCWLVAFGIEIWRDWSEETKAAIESCTQIVALSGYTAESIRRRLSSRPQRVSVIHPAVDLERFTPGAIKQKDRFVLLTMSRLAAAERYKGHDLVLAALPSIIEAVGRPVEYWIVGDGDDRPRLEQLARDLKIAKAVRFLGAVWDERRIEFYRDCDLFVMPSYVERRADGGWTGEGFGIVYIEAAACAKAVVACDEGGQSDAVLHEVTGLLVKPHARAVAEAVTRLLSDPARLEAMGRSARSFVEERFGVSEFNYKWQRVLASECATVAQVGV